MRVAVQNFQSLGSVDLQVEGLTVLVGPSNRGKSALIRAIEAALFNKPGDEFVRTGKKKASVHLTDLPTAGGPPLPAVAWSKGGGKTVYTIGSETFSKVGQGTPPALTEAGYRDIWVGDKDRKKGEYIRPQVSSQFESLFLLHRTGSFVSDVLGAISRHAVLLTAQGRAAGDHRGAKQRHGVRQTDLAAATQQFEALADVPALAARVNALRAGYAAVGEVRQRLATARALLARRALLRPLVAAVMPTPVMLPEHLGYREYAARPRVERRALLQAVLAPLPAVTMPSDYPGDYGVQVAKARGLSAHRRPLVAFVAATLPPTQEWDALLATVDQWGANCRRLTVACERRRHALDTVFRCETAVRSTATEVEITKNALADFLAVNPICPTCEQPVKFSEIYKRSS